MELSLAWRQLCCCRGAADPRMAFRPGVLTIDSDEGVAAELNTRLSKSATLISPELLDFTSNVRIHGWSAQRLAFQTNAVPDAKALIIGSGTEPVRHRCDLDERYSHACNFLPAQSGHILRDGDPSRCDAGRESIFESKR